MVVLGRCRPLQAAAVHLSRQIGGWNVTPPTTERPALRGRLRRASTSERQAQPDVSTRIGESTAIGCNPVLAAAAILHSGERRALSRSS